MEANEAITKQGTTNNRLRKVVSSKDYYLASSRRKERQRASRSGWNAMHKGQSNAKTANATGLKTHVPANFKILRRRLSHNLGNSDPYTLEKLYKTLTRWSTRLCDYSLEMTHLLLLMSLGLAPIAMRC